MCYFLLCCMCYYSSQEIVCLTHVIHNKILKSLCLLILGHVLYCVLYLYLFDCHKSYCMVGTYRTSEDRDLAKEIYLGNVLHLLSWRSEIGKCISLAPTLSYSPLCCFPSHFILSTKLYIGPDCLVYL